MTVKVLAIVCTHNPSDKPMGYIHGCLNAWAGQKDDTRYLADIIIADCMSGEKTREKIKGIYLCDNQFSWTFLDFINQPLPLFQSINHALYVIGDRVKEYDYFAFCHADTRLRHTPDLKKLIGIFEQYPDCLVVAPQSDNDMLVYLPYLREYNLDRKPTKLALEESVNGHMYIWNRRFAEAYNYKLPDILEGCKVESFFTYLCAAIGGDMMLSHDVQIAHIGNMDKGGDYKDQVSPHYGGNFKKILYEGQVWGLGFLESVPKSIAPLKILHDPGRFDNKGHSISSSLYWFLKMGLFLTKGEFDYSKVEYETYL